MNERLKRPRGRPPTGETPKRYFRMSDEEFALVRRAAEVRDSQGSADTNTVSSFIRLTILARAKRVLNSKCGERKPNGIGKTEPSDGL
jgi:hypothetical protein